jgi:hypothetical protein
VNPQAPWECHPHLTEERLLLLADFFSKTRVEVVDLHDPAAGDDAWSLGCRANAWWRNRLEMINKSRDWPWLGMVNAGKALVFTIGDVPVRFYRGQRTRPPHTTLAHRHDELKQLALAFGDSEYRDLKWRFAISTGPTGQVTEIMLAGFSADGVCECYWPIPLTTTAKPSTGPFYEPAEPVPLALPEVVPLRTDVANTQ